ncbi:hypothetical protein TROPICALSUN_58 [Erwinia phage vB_EamM_TropicalSun]|jgi:hypothetical protein|uniref:Uncharacterized protein n=3 Tax=Myosmarvirus TaxID=2843428 RepID=A0A9E8JWM8_9CAUD|nr:hypothetical protein TROPICALSUN_58 [Erwinia phage vB_EamM_TropicalSun]UZS00357.1 hypothetical protein [Serratia phage SMP]
MARLVYRKVGEILQVKIEDDHGNEVDMTMVDCRVVNNSTQGDIQEVVIEGVERTMIQTATAKGK